MRYFLYLFAVAFDQSLLFSFDIVDDGVYGSPLHELFKDKDFRKALKTAPEELKGGIANLAKNLIRPNNQAKEIVRESSDKTE